MSLTANLVEEVAAANLESDYVAVELLWNALVKAAHAKNENDEFKRIQCLVDDLTLGEAAALIQHRSVDTLLNLNPPIETILTDGREKLYTTRAAQEIACIRADRVTDPEKAMDALMCILKRIRNKRVHGFKTPGEPRDAEILGAARPLLSSLCHALIH